MRIAPWVVAVAVLPVGLAAAPSPPATAAQGPPRTMSDIMVKVLYPTADAIFYIETRTPTDEASWTQLQQQMRLLSEAAV